MNPELKQGFIQLVYSTFIHNSEAIAFAVGVLLSLYLLFKKPKRIYLLFLIGFTSLLLRQEYLKHIVSSLSRQTVGVVVTGKGHFRTRRLLDLFFNNFLPFGMYLVGWGSVFIGIVLDRKKD